MDKVISEILQTEHQAQQITKEALLMKKSLQDDIKNEIASLKEKRFNQAKLSIEKSGEEKQKLSDDEVLKIKKTYYQKLEEIDKSFNENREQWVDTIYNKLIGR